MSANAAILKLQLHRFLLPDLPLLQRFMILCALVLMGSGVILGERISNNVQRDMMRSTAFNTALYIGGVIGQELEKPDRTLGLNPDNLTMLDTLFSPERLGEEIVAIKVWSKQGEVLYSTEKSLMGKRFPIEEDLEEALEGQVHYELSSLDKEENVEEKRQFSRLLEVYAPIRSRITGEVIAASEVYQRVDRIPEFISASRTEVWLLMGAAFVLLFVALSGIVKQAGDTILRQNEQLREANRALEERAVTDFLTKLFNHRFFQDRLREELARASRYHTSVSLLFGDLDRFKALNDTYGHQAGDLALETTAQVIKQTIRSTDFAARYGGEEYAIILPNTEKKSAAEVAERIRRNVEAHRIQLPDGRELSVTISLGIASFPLDATEQQELIQQADQAMYLAKRDGRNRVIPCPAMRPSLQPLT